MKYRAFRHMQPSNVVGSVLAAVLLAAASAEAGTPPARGGHSLTEVDGVLLLFGGQAEATRLRAPGARVTVLNDIWEFDAPNEDFEEIADSSPPTARTGHSAAEIDGKKYIFFGEDGDGNIVPDVQVYNPDTNTWQEVQAPPSFFTPRKDLTVVSDGQGGAFLFGGTSDTGAFADLWRFNAADESYDVLAPLPLPAAARSGHSSAFVNGQLTVFGGVDNNGQLLDEEWRYDPDTNQWEELEGLPGAGPSPRASAATAADENSVWLIGGEDDQGALADIWRFDAVEETWSEIPEILDSARSDAAAALAPAGSRGAGNAELVVFGGFDASGDAIADTETVPVTTGNDVVFADRFE